MTNTSKILYAYRRKERERKRMRETTVYFQTQIFHSDKNYCIEI